MLQATAAIDPRVRQAAARGSMPSRPLARWVFVIGAIGVIGVTIDLVQGPAANALPAPMARSAAAVALPIDHSVVKNLLADDSLEPGASVAAYERATATAPGPTPASVQESPIAGAAREPIRSAAVHGSPVAHSVMKDQGDDSPLEPGASVAAYGS